MRKFGVLVEESKIGRDWNIGNSWKCALNIGEISKCLSEF